ncbi:MAG: RNA polymerase sigma-54 factor, partial [bacterium]
MEGKMRLSFGLEARQQQVQKIAPRMIQSMEILQFPIQALQERVEQEIIENPILELAEGDEQLPDALAEPEPQTAADGDQELVVRDDQSNVDDFERLANMDSEMPDQFDDFRPSASRIQQVSDQQHDLMANAVSRQESLNDYLMHQLSEMELESDIESFAERIISTLSASDGGYFRGVLEDLIPRDSEISLKIAEDALRVVQSLDPPGIAARDLKECLLQQIPDDHDLAIPMRRLITDHLEDLAENRLPAIQKRTGYSLETIQQ